MPKFTLGTSDIQEIRAAMHGLRGAQAKAEAVRLASHHRCSVSRVYEITKGLRPARATRSDKGQRRADILTHPGLLLATEQIVTRNLDPDLALELAEANGHEIPVSLATFRRHLREHGINRSALRHGRRPHRNFEAETPGDIFQLDFSAVKERWVDIKTRRILHVSTLEVSKNHPNTNNSRRPLWKFSLVDDKSRFKYVRFVDCPRPNSMYVIEFLLEAFRTMGIPRVLYSDNDSVIKCGRMRRAASILDRAFKDSGGFKLEQHLAGNPQATGKVEVGHQMVEKYEKLIGCLEEKPSLEGLQKFVEDLCDRYNWRECRATGEKPALSFRATTKPLRIPPPALLDSAFMADEFPQKIKPNLTVSFKGESYQLPRKRPFVDFIGTEIIVVWPPETDYFILVAADGTEYEIERKAARPDMAGEFKTPEESIQQQTIKRVRASAAARKQANREAGETLKVPGFHVPLKKGAERPAVMPQAKQETKPELLAALGGGVVPPSATGGRFVTYWQALETFIAEELLQPTPADKAWLKVIFAGREEMLDTDLRSEIEARKPSSIEIQRRA